MDLIQATCNKTGAKIIHLKNDDPEKLFCISLPTYPSNSRGTAHILEHTVLCGCKKYPVKDPFFYMIRRSMNTFMNAFTGSDFTCYPAASLVDEDFENLFDVYFSSVFEPLLEKESFLQEGYRLDLADSKLTRAGIVYNEMKGAYQNPQGLLWRKLQQTLFAGGTYGFDSGGDPQDIPDITHEELKKFHSDHYHPSRAIFYFYGDIDFSKILAMIAPRVSAFEKQEEAPPFLLGARDKNSSQIHFDQYPADPSNRTMICAAAWEVTQIDQVDKTLHYALIDQLLMGHDGSPLKKLLLESDLVDSCDSHLDSEMRQIPYALCFYANVADQDYKKRQTDLALLLQTGLKEVLQNGFQKEEIEAALHQLKLQLLDISSSSYPLGLSLFFRVGLSMQHGIDPLKTLKIHENIRRLETWASNEENITQVIQTSLIEAAPLWQVMEPSATMNEEASKKQQEILDAKNTILSQEEAKALGLEKKALQQWQSRDEKKVIETLPLLRLDAVEEKTKRIPLEKREGSSSEIETFTHRCFTNSFSFHKLQLHQRLTSLEIDNRSAPIALLRARALSLWAELGAADFDYSEASALIEGCCHEIYAKEKTLVHLDGSLLQAQSFKVSALESKVPSAFEELKKHLLQKRFDEESRIEQLIEQHIQEVLTSIADLGYGFAKSASSRTLSKTGAYLDHTGGLCSIVFAQLMQNKDNVQLFVQALPAIYAQTFQGLQQCHFVSTIEREAGINVSPCSIAQLQEIAEAPLSKHCLESYEKLITLLAKTIEEYDRWSSHFGFSIPSEVAFNSMSINAPYHYTDSRSAHAMLTASLMNHLYLHTHIREQGGAYGAGSHFDTARGALTFYSYRDPNILKTFDHFEKALRFLQSEQISATALHEAKLKVLQGIDSPIPPSSRGATAHHRLVTGLSEKERDAFKRAVLSAEIADIQAVVDELLGSSSSEGGKKRSYITFAGQPLLDKAKKKWPLEQRGDFMLYSMKDLSGL